MEPAAPELVLQLPPAAGVSALAFSPDGCLLAVLGYDGEAALWDVASRSMVRRLRGHDGPATALAFSPAGDRLVAGAWDASVWDVASGAWLGTFPGRLAPYAFTAEGICCADLGQDRLLRIDPESGAIRRTVDCRVEGPGFTQVLAYSADGSTAAVLHSDVHSRYYPRTNRMRILASSRRQLQLWDLKTGRERRTVRAPWRGRVAAWDAEGGEFRFRRERLDWFGFAPALSPDGRFFALLTEGIWLWSTRPRGGPPRWLGPADDGRALAFSPDGELLLASAKEGIGIWRVSTGEALPVGCRGIWRADQGAVAPGGRLAVAAALRPRLSAWEPANGGSLNLLLSAGPEPRRVAFSPEGARVVVRYDDGVLRAWSSRTAGLEAPAVADALPGLDAVQFPREQVLSPDERFRAVNEEACVSFEEAASGHALWTHRPEQDGTAALAFTPDSRSVVIASCYAAEVGLWEAATGTRMRSFPGHPGGVLDAACSPDGRLLVTVGRGSTLKFWDLATGRLRVTCVLARPDIGCDEEWVAFTPEGYYHGSPGAERLIRWAVGAQLNPADTFAERFRRPERVAEGLAEDPRPSAGDGM